MSHPVYESPPATRWHDNAKYHIPDNCLECQSEKYKDYGVYATWNWWGDEDDKGNFWQMKSRDDSKKELRWLTMIGCGTLALDGDGPPIQKWKARLDDPVSQPHGYISSACGFTSDLLQFPVDVRTYDFVITGELIKRYGNNLKVIYQKPEIQTYEPLVRCFRYDAYWKDGAETRDISVAAYMEAACSLVGNVTTNEYYSTMGLNTAIAIDIDNSNHQPYYWYLTADGVKPYQRLNRRYCLKIDREDL